MSKKKQQILLTFDVEEFDIPLEYNCPIDVREQMEKGMEGLQALSPLLNNHKYNCTLFTTANFALSYPDEIKSLSKQHEIASHTYFHSAFKNSDLAESKKVLEQITGQQITGLRMPRMREVDMKEVQLAGYTYDSSINPTWLPGRYNYTHLPRTPYFQDQIIRIPASVSPTFRIPLFWLAFKNFPYAVFKKLALQTLRKDKALNLYFHPWEFTEIENYHLPGYVKKDAGPRLLNKLSRLLRDLENEGEFITFSKYLEINNF